MYQTWISHQACAAGLGADRGGHGAHGADGGSTRASFQPGWGGHRFPDGGLCFSWCCRREADACDFVHWSKQAILGLALKIPEQQ